MAKSSLNNPSRSGPSASGEESDNLGIAKKIARYRLRLEPQADGTVLGWCPELPGLAVSADDEVECLAILKRGMLKHCQLLVRRGQPLPVPLVDQSEALTEQVNVRLTPREKAELAEQASRAKRSQSDVLRELLRRSAEPGGAAQARSDGDPAAPRPAATPRSSTRNLAASNPASGAGDLSRRITGTRSTPVASRAWVMMRRSPAGNEGFHAAERQFRALQNGDYRHQIRSVMTLLGQFDIGLIFEGEDSEQVSEFTGFLRQVAAPRLESSVTYMSAGLDVRSFPKRSPGDGAGYVVAIKTSSDAPNSLVADIRAIEEVQLADEVHGDYDILAFVLVKGDVNQRLRDVLGRIADTPGVLRTSTMSEVQ